MLPQGLGWLASPPLPGLGPRVFMLPFGTQCLLPSVDVGQDLSRTLVSALNQSEELPLALDDMGSFLGTSVETPTKGDASSCTVTRQINVKIPQ